MFLMEAAEFSCLGSLSLFLPSLPPSLSSPLYLPLCVLLTISSVQLSTSVVAGSPLLVVRVIVDPTYLSLSDMRDRPARLKEGQIVHNYMYIHVYVHVHIHVQCTCMYICTHVPCTHNYIYVCTYNYVCAKRKKVQTLDSCFRLLAPISRVQHDLSLALLGLNSPCTCIYMYMYIHILYN